MKKIIILALSVLFVLCVLSCDGSVYSSVVNSSGKTITFASWTYGNYTFSFAKDSESLDKITITTTANTWEELAGIELGYDFLISYSGSVPSSYKFSGLKFKNFELVFYGDVYNVAGFSGTFEDEEESNLYILNEPYEDGSESNIDIFEMEEDVITDGATYYIAYGFGS